MDKEHDMLLSSFFLIPKVLRSSLKISLFNFWFFVDLDQEDSKCIFVNITNLNTILLTGLRIS